MFLLIFQSLVVLNRLSFLLDRLGCVLVGFARRRGLFVVLFVALNVLGCLFGRRFHSFHFGGLLNLSFYEIGQHQYVVLLIRVVLVLFLFRNICG